MISELFQWFHSQPLEFQAGLLLIGADIFAGWLPSRFTRWPGIILSVAKRMHDFGTDPEKMTKEALNKRLKAIVAEFNRTKAQRDKFKDEN